MNIDLDDKVSFLSEITMTCFLCTIPSSSVIVTPKDKPYITPYLKLLINKRWSSYRHGNYAAYSQLSAKIKSLLKKEVEKKKKRKVEMGSACTEWVKRFMEGSK